MLVTLGDRSFSAAAPYLWNSLLAELGDIQSLAVFKRKAENLFILCSFYNVTGLTFSLSVLPVLIKFIIIIINILYYYC